MLRNFLMAKFMPSGFVFANSHHTLKFWLANCKFFESLSLLQSTTH